MFAILVKASSKLDLFTITLAEKLARSKKTTLNCKSVQKIIGKYNMSNSAQASDRLIMRNRPYAFLLWAQP